MCGIAGIAAPEGFDPRLLVKMTQVVEHRGPDGFGFAFYPADKGGRGEVFYNELRLPSFGRPRLGLGHRRLAIIDLSSQGAQPMQAGLGTLSITFNGEIYNYLEIRKILKGLGHDFVTQTDTEVILHAYQEWGTECFQRFNGMWALALWDSTRQKLVCSRDRFGVKPFYYYLGAHAFLFGSEIKQLLECPDVRREANDRAVLAFLDHGLKDHSSDTFFKGILQLPGGHCLILDLTGASLIPEIQSYWELAIQPIQIHEQEAAQQFLAKFSNAVSLRLRSDVPVGSCLSGGLDSSSIVCVARKVAPDHDFHTFSSCSEDPAHDEREYLLEVVQAARVRPHLIFPQPQEFWREFKRLLWHQDEPVADTSVFAQWCVMQEARRERVPVLLDGQGGDETLCGYLKFYYFYLWHLLKQGAPSVFLEACCQVRQGSLRSAWAGAQRYLPGLLRRSPALSQRVCRAKYSREDRNGFVRLGPGASVAERQKTDLLRYSVPMLFHYEDRNAMAHSIESREPFLDFELVEFLVNLPIPLKLRRGWTKWILRESLKGVLPEKVRLRRDKMWFPSPQKRWLKQESGPQIQEIFAAEDLRLSRLLERKRLREEVANFSAGSPGSLSDAELFRVLSLEMWARTFDVC